MGFYIHWAKDSTIALWERLIAFSAPKQTKVSSSSQAISVVLGDSYAFDTSNKDTSKLADLKYLDFRHIKRDFSYGHPYQGFTPNDRIELSNFVQSYGRQAALETANAWVMASYPFSLQSTKFEIDIHEEENSSSQMGIQLFTCIF